MIGNIQPYLHQNSNLTDSFMKPYCGLCRSLRKQYDLPSSLLLNYELSFILLSLDKYISGEEILTRCPSSGFMKKRPAYTHPAVDKAAQLSIILGWIKTIDFLADEKKQFSKRALMKMAEKKLGKRSSDILSTLSPETHLAIVDYVQLSKNSEENIENIRKKTFSLSSQVCYEIAVMTDLPASDRIVYMEFFGRLGVSIALLDPLVDIEKDLEQKTFNPIVDTYNKNGEELKQHYISFFEEYKLSYFSLQESLKKEHRFSAHFSQLLSKSLESGFSKIRKATDQLFGGIEDKMLDAMIGCSKSCEPKTQGRTFSFLGAFISIDSCGNGCKPPDCGRGCRNADCGKGCKGGDCGNGCGGGDCGGGGC